MPPPAAAEADIGRASTIPSAAQVPADEDVRRLVGFCRDRARSMREVCDALDCSPRKAEALLQRARALGYTIDVAGGAVAWTDPSLDERRTDVTVAPIAGTYHLGVISDTHFGSRHCMGAALHDWVLRAYEKGVRIVVHAGDMLAGQDPKIRWDLKAHGLDAQCAAAFDGQA